MYICLCHGITDSQIRDAISGGCCSFREVRTSLKVATQCGKCACAARGVVKETLDKSLLAQVEQPLAACQIGTTTAPIALEVG